MDAFTSGCLVVMWVTTLAAVYAAEVNRHRHGTEWPWVMWAQLSAAFYVSALEAWVFL